MGIHLLITNRSLRVVGDPITRWTSLDVTRRRNEPGGGTVKLSRADITADQLAPGNRIVMVRDGQVFSSGPIERPGPENWSVDGEDVGPGTAEVTWADDLASVVARRTYPTPSAASTAQTDARWTATGAAADVIRSLVNLNAGPGALSYRRVPGLVLGAGAGIGATVTFGTRFEPLGDALRTVALLGGGLAFRVVQVDRMLEFQVSEPRDLTRRVRFSRGLRNLRSYQYEPAAPTVTTAIVGGQDEGADRVIVERTNTDAEAAWGRMETFVDQRQSDDTPGDTTELEQAGDEALANGAETARLSAVCIDTPAQRYGVDYDINDLVSIELNSGVVLVDVVRGVSLAHTPREGERVSVLIGTEDPSTDALWIAYLRDLARRLDRMEAR